MMPRLPARRLAIAAALACAGAVPAWAQGGIDPRITIRAQALEREGERGLAVDLLGRYLAVSQSDGRAWYQLGRFYLLDAREWHLHHAGEPDGELLLDFATTAFDQSSRLAIDSAALLRAVAEMERARLKVERDGWAATRLAWRRAGAPPLPAPVEELGRNLVGSCPAGGVLLTSGELESVAAWYAVLVVRQADDVLPLRTQLYGADARYRARMAEQLGVDSLLALREALALVAERRAICLAPGADPAAAPEGLAWRPARLVRVSRMNGSAERPLQLTALLEARKAKRPLWVHEVREVYSEAARRNPLLCEPLGTVFGDEPPPACRP